MKFEKEFRKDHPETIGETEHCFDLLNYSEWLENKIEELSNKTDVVKMNKFKCKLKSRKQMEAEIPRERWGWWIDVCPGKTLVLRRATASDLRRCTLAEGDNRNPGNFFCELSEKGSLVGKEAVEYVLMNPGDV